MVRSYLALQRLEDKNWISARWGVSENNRKARFYSLTAKGRQQLVEKTSEWQRLTKAMGLILDGRPNSEEAWSCSDAEEGQTTLPGRSNRISISMPMR
jgi:DNA-binding PadR family transcriptional regulator